MTRFAILLFAILAATAGGPSALPAAALEDALVRLESLRPKTAADLPKIDLAATTAAAVATEQAAAETLAAVSSPRPDVVLAQAERMLAAKPRVDHGLDQLFALRSELAGIESADQQRIAIRNYLRVMASWIDLAGRLRYMQYDICNTAASQLAARPAERQRLVDLLAKHRSSVGAIVMADLLTDAPPGSPAYGRPVSPALRFKVLELVAVTGETECLPQLAELVATPGTPPALVIQTAETIRRVGLPQPPRPGQVPTLPEPAILPAELRDVLAGLVLPANAAELRARRDELLAWLDKRLGGLPEPSYRWGGVDLAPGDWLLMRNPSPYNLFTDFSPGLFTHVGVVALEKGTDGVQRMVLVDLPEAGVKMPATNIDTFVQRSRHYLFLRHPDSEVARKMGETAASLIGNETAFDLNFRTDRVLELAGQPLAGKKITTYCAGLLLLCALESGRPRQEFFPIAESPAAGLTVDNLAQLGMSFGKDFVTPTGALFSQQLQIVGRREPTYDPRREVEEAVFDYFAQQLAVRKLQTSPDLYQSLRLKVAEAAKHNPLLAQAIVTAAGVNAETDVVAAARAAAVVETLDEVAFGSSGDFLKAQDAIRGAPTDRRSERALTPAQRATLQTYRSRHPRQYDLWQQQRISRRQLRIELVQYYIAQGRQQLDRRFFGGPAPAAVRGK